VDIKEGRLIRLSAIPARVAWLPARRDGKPLSGETVRGWAVDGLRTRSGRIVRLECMPCGHGLATNEAALLRFFDRLEKPPAESRERRRPILAKF